MSEKAPRIPEMPANQEASVEHISHERHTSHEKSHETTSEHTQEKLEDIRRTVEVQSRSKRESVIDKPQSSPVSTHSYVNKELKSVMLSRTLSRIQKSLPAPQRALSKVVHNKVVDKVSIASEKTVARPYGIFGGGLLALLGSIFSTWLAKQYGLQYNYIAFALFFITGYIATTILELCISLIKRTKN